MPVTVIVGGQYGSEGKGKVAHYFAKQMGASIAIRVGGPNSGHTVIDEKGNPLIFRQLPTAAILPNVSCVLPAGSYIDVDLLHQEVISAGMSVDRLIVDPNATVIDATDRALEAASTLRQTIGSTGSGTGSAVLKRIKRGDQTCLAREHPRLKDFLRPALPFLRQRLNQKQRVVVEGTQGHGLSLLHSPYYPFATSRDTTASAFISESGLSPLDVDDVVLVIRSFPIRVAGNSGPLEREIDWQTVTQEALSPIPLIEFTSVTQAVRRVGRFEKEIVCTAICSNRPTRIVLNHIDYIDAQIRSSGLITAPGEMFIRSVEEAINHPIDYVGLGPASLLERAGAVQTKRSAG